MGAWNEESRANCHPADYPTEGSGYCAGRLEGWYNGGALNQINTDRDDWGTCQKLFKGCQCADCRNSMTGCVDYRCDDETDERKNGRCYKAGTTEETSEQMYDFCYESTKVGREYCEKDLGNCAVGQYLKGCQRASPGVCVNCPVELAVGKYWARKGYGVTSCQQKTCSIPDKGQFIKTACAAGADAEILSCAYISGNKQSRNVSIQSDEQKIDISKGIAFEVVFGVDRWYCPAGNVVLRLPDNSITPNYYSFECKAGYYLQDTACLQCPPGYACASGQKFQCPANYYSNTYAATTCTLCTYTCDPGKKPLRCAAGSMSNPGCVSCGACGGLQCLQSTYDVRQLADKCTPGTASWPSCRK